MPKITAGILAYRFRNNEIEVFLVHPGGPFWQNKDEHAWSIPKGEPDPDEELLNTAQREFNEETGLTVQGRFQEMKPVRQSSDKIVHAWAVEAQLDPTNIKSNSFTAEWPPHSGKQQQFPEVDKAEWFPIAIAREKIHKGQIPLLEQLELMLKKS